MNAIVGIVCYRGVVGKLHVDASHIVHVGYHRFSDKSDVKTAEFLPIRPPNVPKPLHNGLEAIVILDRKFEVMALVKDLKPFFPNLFANTEEFWLGYDGLELIGAPNTLCVPFYWPQETWRLACVFCSYQHVDLASDFNWEVYERARANRMIGQSLETVKMLDERYTD